MREIRFRAWDVGRKKMFQVAKMVFNLSAPGSVLLVTPYGYDEFSKHRRSESPREVVDAVGALIVLEQFTGLKDRAGKDIYEGDIVNEEMRHIKAEIIWNQSTCAFVRKEIKHHGTKVNWEFYPVDSKNYEVIGNIHEHPALMK